MVSSSHLKQYFFAHRKDAKYAEMIDFLFAVDLPSLKLWQGKEGGKEKQLSPAESATIVGSKFNPKVVDLYECQLILISNLSTVEPFCFPPTQRKAKNF